MRYGSSPLVGEDERLQVVRDLTGRLIDAQEAERSRLARELHDDFSQRLALLAVKVDRLRQSPPGDAEALQAAFSGLHVDVQGLAKDVRRMSHDLHPARLEQLGLASALHRLCTDLSAADRVAIRCDTSDVPRHLPADMALCLFRVAQEALHNVVKHSGAAAAVVELSFRAGTLHLMVRDDGCGFQVTAARRGGTLGLASMSERVRLIAGRLAIRSAPGQGTRIDVHAALARKATVAVGPSGERAGATG